MSNLNVHRCLLEGSMKQKRPPSENTIQLFGAGPKNLHFNKFPRDELIMLVWRQHVGNHRLHSVTYSTTVEVSVYLVQSFPTNILCPLCQMVFPPINKISPKVKYDYRIPSSPLNYTTLFWASPSYRYSTHETKIVMYVS